MPKATAFCVCGAPLLLADEAAPAQLDALVDLDRRGGGKGQHPKLAAAPPMTEERADADGDVVHLEHAATWRRAGAWAIDAVPFLAAAEALGAKLLRESRAGLPPAEGLDGLVDLFARERLIFVSLSVAVVLAISVYATLAHALAGATLGKWLLGLRVVGPDGARPSPGRSAVRSALGLLSCALLGLGFLLAFFTRSGRALHDLIARTWVVKAP